MVIVFKVGTRRALVKFQSKPSHGSDNMFGDFRLHFLKFHKAVLSNENIHLEGNSLDSLLHNTYKQARFRRYICVACEPKVEIFSEKSKIENGCAGKHILNSSI